MPIENLIENLDLSDPAQYGKLSYTAYLVLCASQEAVRLAIVGNEFIRPLLNAQELAILSINPDVNSSSSTGAKNNPPKTTSTPSVALEKLTGKTLGALGKANVFIAQRILSDQQLHNRLEIADLLTLASGQEPGHTIIAEQFFEVGNTPLLAQLSGGQLTLLGQAHYSIGQKIMESPALIKKLGSENIKILSEQYLFVRYQIANQKSIADKLAPNYIGQCKREIEICQHISEIVRLNNLIKQMGLGNRF